jgi:hypothetical protein
MAKRVVLVAAIIAAVALGATASLVVLATSGGSVGQGGGLLRHLHGVGQHMHGADQHHGEMARLIERLELTADQRRHLDRVHEIFGAHGDGAPGAMERLHEELMAQFEQGDLDAGEIRGVVDEHVEQMREMAYAVTDEIVALVNGLDARQRDIVLEHLQAGHAGHQGHGH